MKYLFVFITIILFVISVSAQNTDVYNVGRVIDLNYTALSVADDVCAYYVKGNQVFYTFKTTQGTDNGSDQVHSKPFYIGDCNKADGFARVTTSGTDDVDVIYHFSWDNRNTWQTITPATLNNIGSTAKGDTLGIQAGVDQKAGFHGATWMIIEIEEDGSGATFDDGDIAIATFSFTLDGTVKEGKDLFLGRPRVAKTSNTNP